MPEQNSHTEWWGILLPLLREVLASYGCLQQLYTHTKQGILLQISGSHSSCVNMDPVAGWWQCVKFGCTAKVFKIPNVSIFKVKWIPNYLYWHRPLGSHLISKLERWSLSETLAIQPTSTQYHHQKQDPHYNILLYPLYLQHLCLTSLKHKFHILDYVILRCPCNYWVRKRVTMPQ